MKKIIKDCGIREITEDIICNKCGNTCQGWESGVYNGLIEKTVHGNYGSEIFDDGDKYTFSLCEYCLQELFNYCKIRPQNESYYYSYELEKD